MCEDDGIFLEFNLRVIGHQGKPTVQVKIEFDPPLADETNYWDGSGASVLASRVLEQLKGVVG